MSSQDVKNILLRSLSDDDFLNSMLTDPDAALAGYQLTPEEHTALVTHSRDVLTLARGGDDVGWGTLTLPTIWPLAYITTDPITRERLERVLTQRKQALVKPIDELYGTVASLRDLPPEERTQRINVLLQDLEGINAGGQ